MDKNLDLSKRDIEVNNCIHAAHHDFYLLWRKQAENKVRRLPFDETLYQNGGMEKRPSLGHIVNCEPCLKVVKRKYDAYLSIKELQDYLGITQDEAFKNWCHDFDKAIKLGNSKIMMVNTIESIQYKLTELCSSNPKFKEFYIQLRKLGLTALVGGSVRDIILTHKPRDYDFIVDTTQENLKNLVENSSLEYDINQFGGYKVTFEKFEIDIWTLESTWVFQKETAWDKTFENWLKTPFFNIDCIIYLIEEEKLIENGFTKAFKDNQLDINYIKNKLPNSCFLKTLIHQKKYGLGLSENLLAYQRERITGPKPLTLLKLRNLHRIIFKEEFPLSYLDFLPQDLKEILRRIEC